MSGGSHEYLYLKEATDRVDPEVVERMVERLNGLGCYGAANAIRRYFNPAVPGLSDEIRELMRAVEWVDSGDGADLAKAIQDYREKHITVIALDSEVSNAS